MRVRALNSMAQFGSKERFSIFHIGLVTVSPNINTVSGLGTAPKMHTYDFIALMIIKKIICLLEVRNDSPIKRDIICQRRAGAPDNPTMYNT